jgi:hypothetical protein
MSRISRKSIRTIGGISGIVLCLATAPSLASQQTPPPVQAADHAAIISKYCVSCHNGRAKVGGLALDAMDYDNLPAGAAVWEKSVKKLRVGMMPPQGAPQPDTATRLELVTWLTTTLDRAAAAKPNPGRPVLHRLNRAEYANAVHDLLALDVDPSTLLPPDDSAYGFDNVGDVLGMSPVLLERFMEAANKVGALAIGDPEISAPPARPSTSARTRRRTPTSRASRSARSAASSRRSRCRWTPSIRSR